MMSDCQVLPEEVALSFDCGEESLIGILHEGAADAVTGVLIIVGGRQYRAGAHRQFVRLARFLAKEGIPVFRFDVRGMGDSTGGVRHFLSLDDDIARAVSVFQEHVPTVQSVALWGLCDGASATILYAQSDPRIEGVMLVNPWISTEGGIARTYLKHYYRSRFGDAELWRKILSGNFNWSGSLRSLRLLINQVLDKPDAAQNNNVTLPDIIFNALDQYKGDVRILISDRDLTAREFEDEYKQRASDSRMLHLHAHKLTRVSADHTFSTAESHQELCRLTSQWVRALN